MLSAAVGHVTRGELRSVVGNAVVAALLLWVAHVRTRVHPIRAGRG